MSSETGELKTVVRERERHTQLREKMKTDEEKRIKYGHDLFFTVIFLNLDNTNPICVSYKYPRRKGSSMYIEGKTARGETSPSPYEYNL